MKSQMCDRAQYQLLGVIVVVLLLCAFVLRSGCSKHSAQNGPNVTSGAARRFAFDRVKDVLKSPSTAKLAEDVPPQIVHSGNRYRVRIAVDAQNLFGATVREYFDVDLFRGRELSLEKITRVKPGQPLYPPGN